MGQKKHIKLAFSPLLYLLYNVGKLEKLSLPLTSLNFLISWFGIIVLIEVAGVIAQIICRKAETGIDGRE